MKVNQCKNGTITIMGLSVNMYNAIMYKLQTQAIKNKEQMDSPYLPERLQEVITELSR